MSDLFQYQEAGAWMYNLGEKAHSGSDRICHWRMARGIVQKRNNHDILPSRDLFGSAREN